MNKNMAILISLLITGISGTALSFNQEQREILYTLDELEQNFASVPMITENIDMFIGIMQMNIQMTEKRLLVAQKAREKALLTGVAAVAVALGVRAGWNWSNRSLIKPLISKLSYNFARKSEELSFQLFAGMVSMYNICVGMHIYDAFKAHNGLESSLALDKKVLAKLEDVKESLAYDSAESIKSVQAQLLNSAA